MKTAVIGVRIGHGSGSGTTKGGQWDFRQAFTGVLMQARVVYRDARFSQAKGDAAAE